MLVLVEDKRLGDVLKIGSLLFEVSEGFFDRSINAQPRKARTHEATCFVLFECQQGIYFRARRLIQKLQVLGPLALAHLLQNVCDIGGRKQAHPHAALTLRKLAQQIGLIRRRERQKEVILGPARQSVELSGALAAWYPTPTVGKV